MDKYLQTGNFLGFWRSGEQDGDYVGNCRTESSRKAHHESLARLLAHRRRRVDVAGTVLAAHIRAAMGASD